MPGGEVADAPSGFTEMCARSVALCAAGLPIDPAAITAQADPRGMNVMATGGIKAQNAQIFRQDDAAPQPAAYIAAGAGLPLTFQTLKDINKEVNHNAIQRTDIDQMGIDEFWRRPINYQHPVGDCEDLAIEKRMRLVERGFPASRLFYAVTFRASIGLHTILVARLDDGDYVLDSMSPHVLRWNETGYVWLRQQSTEDPLLWMRVDNTPSRRMANTAPARAES
ncbi:transglutaminase-like cysteine peptidase [Sphingobium sp. H39-3-25]|uniref:transglutaminase-like cysteine peptidase n=1 Tax=Sphingobium arseniciresistens TaxID=3030834 RepID=UPI0023B9E775|nr:transglutaminase-like cysteine peptidase [Sphingobium arseniciresistens]